MDQARGRAEANMRMQGAQATLKAFHDDAMETRGLAHRARRAADNSVGAGTTKEILGDLLNLPVPCLIRRYAHRNYIVNLSESI